MTPRFITAFWIGAHRLRLARPMRSEGHESLGMQAGHDASVNRPTQARTVLISASISSEQAPSLASGGSNLSSGRTTEFLPFLL